MDIYLHLWNAVQLPGPPLTNHCASTVTDVTGYPPYNSKPKIVLLTTKNDDNDLEFSGQSSSDICWLTFLSRLSKEASIDL